MTREERVDTYAAIDLGSNSFHLLVARRQHGELRVIDQIKEMVRLAAGLDKRGRLDIEVRDRALDCLAIFGQRLRGIPQENIRAVGTQTLRRLKNANAFLMVAETALGCPVDIIAGREEARLVYLGVSQGVSGIDRRRLVIDIGGGSTELVIGQGLTPIEMESVQYGCVSLTRWYFGSGKISRRRWQKALRAVLADLQELRVRYRASGWEVAIGSSGTVRAAESICQAMGWCERGITREAVYRLRDALIASKTIEAVDLPGLSERRHPVIAGGVVMLQACFEALDIEQLEVSPFALREGVLHDLLGRLEHRDPRDKTVQALKARYGVDEAQVARVKGAALGAFDAIAPSAGLGDVHRQLLAWAADLHEIGLGVSHSQYQKHSGYLVRESDMAGFTRQEQLFLAELVATHRRSIGSGFGESLPTRMRGALRWCLFCLRLACILARTREDGALPQSRLAMGERGVVLSLDANWADGHPLTLTDLEQEKLQLAEVEVALSLDTGRRTADAS